MDSLIFSLLYKWNHLSLIVISQNWSLPEFIELLLWLDRKFLKCFTPRHLETWKTTIIKRYLSRIRKKWIIMMWISQISFPLVVTLWRFIKRMFPFSQFSLWQVYWIPQWRIQKIWAIHLFLMSYWLIARAVIGLSNVHTPIYKNTSMTYLLI